MTINHTWLYPLAVQRVEQGCQRFLSGQSDIETLQAVLRDAEREIVALDEKWLRSALFEAENQLEEIRFTTSDDAQRPAAENVVRQLLRAITTPPA